MKKAIILSLLFSAILFSCGTRTSNNSKTSKNVDTITVNVDEQGNMTLGNKSIDIDNLEQLLIDSVNTLKKNGQTTIPEFNLVVEGEGMLMGGRGEVQDIFEDVKTKLQ